MGGENHVSRRTFPGGLAATAGAGALAGCDFGDFRSQAKRGTESETGPRTEATTQQPSRTRFAFDYDSDAETLAITHDGGDPVRKLALQIRGRGFADVEGADQTGQGRWQGTASGTVDGSDAVVEGDSVTVGVRPDYAVRVVSRPSRSSEPATLGSDTGPEA